MHRATLYKECSQSWLLAHAKHIKKELYTPRYLYIFIQRYNHRSSILYAHHRIKYLLAAHIQSLARQRQVHYITYRYIQFQFIKSCITCFCVCANEWSLACSTRRSLVRAAATPYSKQRIILKWFYNFCVS